MNDIDKKILRLRAEGKGPKAIGTAVGLKRDAVRRRLAKLSAPALPSTVIAGQKAEDERTVESPPSARIVTLDELLAHAKVDLTQWEVRDYLINKWEVGAVGPDKTIVVEPLFQVKAWLKRSREGAVLAQLREQILDDIRAERAIGRIPRNIVSTLNRMDAGSPVDGHLLVLSLVDLHVGKLSWREETGEDYDIRIAERVFVDALEDLLAKASGFPVAEIVLVIGNDLLQADNPEGTTTSGTVVDTDSRYIKAFRRARGLMSWALKRCAKIAPTTGIVVPGNHDRQSAFHVGEVLAAEFDGDLYVTIDNGAKLRKYKQYGVNLLGFTHGSDEKHAELPLIMANEQPQAWAGTQHREWLLGHLHKMKETRWTAGDEYQGVRVRICPSLCATDAWHYRMGYKSRKAAEAFLYHRTAGYAGHFSSNVLPVVEAVKVAA